MKIALSGVETNNKGAELMLYAILQEIERKYPDAIVYLPAYSIVQGSSYKIRSAIDLRYNPYEKLNHFFCKLRINKICEKIGFHFFDEMLNGNWAIPFCDYYFDASGFALSDQQMNNKVWINGINSRVINYGKKSTKIIYLPQAVGPFEREDSKAIIINHSKNVDLFFARESVSYDYLKKIGFDINKVKVYPDFTSTVDGIFPSTYEHLRGGVCIIPNYKMIDKGVISLSNYLKLITSIIENCKKLNKKVYLLNHEGKGDEVLAYKCANVLEEHVDVVTGLNALEVKGLIGSAYLCISSRFHGVASALNSCVPCLATSWSHKYAELFKDYGLGNMVLPIENVDKCINILEEYLQFSNNEKYHQHLVKKVPQLMKYTEKMWKEIWSI